MNINFLAQINLRKFLETSYLFEIKPDIEGLYQYLGLVFSIFILAALVLMVKAKKKDEVFKILYAKIINLLLFGGIFGLILILFRYEGIPYLGSRLFLLILFFILIIWALTILWYRFKILPQKVKEEQKRQAFEKYLP